MAPTVNEFLPVKGVVAGVLWSFIELHLEAQTKLYLMISEKQGLKTSQKS